MLKKTSSPQSGQNTKTNAHQMTIDYQNALLPKVSRSFSLTIPMLPPSLREAVTNLYLLSRIADTIEDETNVSPEHKARFEEALIEAVCGSAHPAHFTAVIARHLSQQIPPYERELLLNLPLILEVTQSLSLAQQNAIKNCLTIMAHGMAHHQRQNNRLGMISLTSLEHYIYFSAGVVGEALTELFIEHDPTLIPHRAAMMRLALSFGQGLQLTNILKDYWEDKKRDIRWLPDDIMTKHNFSPDEDTTGKEEIALANVFDEMIGITHAHLRRALDYALLIPPYQTGMRRFCLVNIFLALLVLQKRSQATFALCHELKLSQSALAATVLGTRWLIGFNPIVRRLYELAAHGLNTATLQPEWLDTAADLLPWPKRDMPWDLVSPCIYPRRNEAPRQETQRAITEV